MAMIDDCMNEFKKKLQAECFILCFYTMHTGHVALLSYLYLLHFHTRITMPSLS